MAKHPAPSLSPDILLARDRGDAVSSGERVVEPRTAARAAEATPLTLARGQSFHGYVGRGTVFHVREGVVLLTLAPRWLAASLSRTTVSLAAGQVYVVQTPGWITLASGAGAHIVCRDDDRAQPSSRLARRLRRLVQRFGD
ncbi:hypothetical protein [Pandoraea sp. NPDC087047]|uniref:hypothetical protein n=1 Tax=Pandoraea sp. NPDC087047 TaxID=3364390 RepID=UPI003829D5E1